MTSDATAIAAPLKQPRGLYLLFGVEMWERFSYYGMRAFLVLFLTSTNGGFGWTKPHASLLYAWYTGLVYLTPLLGGFMADRVLGTHRAVVFGSFVIATGHFCLAAPGKVTFFIGLSLIILGTGFHKSNISTMVGQLYQQGDARRDAAFTIFYMGINLGAFLGQIVCGFLAEDQRFGWHWGFASAGVGMVLGTAAYLYWRRPLLGTIGEAPKVRVAKTEHPKHPMTPEEKDRILAICLLAIFNIFFWSAFEQAGSSMTFFANERTDRMIGSFQIKTSWFQSANALTIVTFAPLFAKLWVWLGRKKLEPTIPVKFVWSLVFVAMGFAVLVVAARLSEGGVKVSPLFLIAAYVFHTWGELCLSPVGLSMVTKMAPTRYASMMMGIWFGSMALADFAGGMMASTVERIERGEFFTILGGQADFFLIFVIVPVAAALIMWAFSGSIRRLMHGRA